MLGGGLWRDQCEELWVELMEGLQGRSTLKCLVIELPEFMDKSWVRPVVGMLEANSSLIHFTVAIAYRHRDSSTFSSMVKAASNSKSLELLHVSASIKNFCLESWKVLMASLIPQDSSIKVSRDTDLRNGSLSNLQPTTSLRDLRMTVCRPWELELVSSEIVQEAVKWFSTMLVANRTLKTLQIPSFMHSAEDLLLVLCALSQNRYITKLRFLDDGFRDPSFHHYSDQYSARVISALLTLMETNYWLTSVDVKGTILDLSPYKEQIEARLERNRRISSAHIFVQPTSCRVFLCGFPKAGKTTLRQKMEYILEQRQNRFHPGYSISRRIEISSKRILNRTKGVEVVPINVGSVKLSIWDMGGQDEFHAFHDLVIPNLSDTGSASLFIVTCAIAHGKDKVKNTEEIGNELRYWLRFLSSNTRTSGNSKPHVIMIFTHVDCLPKSMRKSMRGHVEGLLKSVKGMFAECFEFAGREYFVKSYSTKMVDPFVECVVKEVNTRLTKAPPIYQACVQMEEAIAECRRAFPTKPIRKWKDFMAMYMQVKFHEVLQPEEQVALQLEEICETVASDLNEGGHIIFFKDLKDIVVVDPNWFGTRIIGSIFSVDHECLDAMEPVTTKKGYASRDKLKSVLEMSFSDGKGSLKERPDEVLHVDIEDVIEVMKRMNMCYERGRDPKQVFIPATLRDEDGVAHGGRRKLKWNVIASSSRQRIIYIGRRLQCEDPVRTFFSRGFFPRLQVVFEGKFGSNGAFSLEKNLVGFTENGMEVLVEYSGDVLGGDHLDGYIDIMVQSTKDSVKTLEFVKETLIKVTRDLCGSATFGCQGVTLSESILRPACVEELWLCIDRRDQSIKEDSLIEEMFCKAEFEGYVHHWPLNPRKHDDHRGDEAESLLGDVVWIEKVVSRRIEDMDTVGKILMEQDQKALPPGCNEVAEDVVSREMKGAGQEDELDSLTSLYLKLRRDIFEVRDELMEVVYKMGVEVVKNLEKHSEELKKQCEEQKKHFEEQIKDLRRVVLGRISNSTNRLINHSIHSQQRQVPSFAYVTTEDLGTGEWLISSLVPGLKSVRLHVMCEHNREIHTVGGQKGIALLMEKENFRTFRPYVIWGLRIMSMLMKVSAQVTAGLGSMVPDLEQSLLKGVASVIPNVSSDVLGPHGTPLQEVNLLGMQDLPGESETRAAHQWLVNRLKGEDLERVFGLRRVWYTDGSNEFAWLCKKHIDEGYRTGVLQLCPTGATSKDK